MPGAKAVSVPKKDKESDCTQILCQQLLTPGDMEECLQSYEGTYF